MHKEKKHNRFVSYMKDSWNVFVSSFKNIGLQHLFVILADILFFVVTYGIYFVITQILTKMALAMPDVSTLNMMSIENAQSAVAGFNRFLYILGFSCLIFLMLVLITWSFSRYCIWNLIVTGRFQVRKFWRFVVANLAWFFVWLIPLIYVMYPVFIIAKQQLQVPKIPLFTIISIVVILVAMMHFTYLYFIGFIQEKKIGRAFAFAFRTGTVKIRFLLVSYLVMLIVFFILSLCTLPLNYLSQKVNLVISIVVLLMYVTWLRAYLSKNVLAIYH